MPGQPEHADAATTQLAAVALEAARAAASVIRAAAPRVRDIVWQEKKAKDFVSEVDLAAEATIIAVVRQRVPHATFLAEETASSISPEMLEAGLVFVVDPLDGTTNFLHGYPEYAVSVGVLQGGTLRAGVVIDVPLGEVFTATEGGGAFRDGTPIHVSPIDKPGRALFGTGFPFRRVEDIAPYLLQLDRVMRGASGVRRAGAAALDLAAVACGRYEGFWEPRLSPWDIAAGLLLVREAGGVATTFSGEPCPVAHTSIAAGSPAMHRWLLGQLHGETGEGRRP